MVQKIVYHVYKLDGIIVLNHKMVTKGGLNCHCYDQALYDHENEEKYMYTEFRLTLKRLYCMSLILLGPMAIKRIGSIIIVISRGPFNQQRLHAVRLASELGYGYVISPMENS